MVKIILLCIILSLVAIYDLHVHQIDIKIVFLHSHLNKEVHMAQVEGYIDSYFLHKFFKLLQYRYGLEKNLPYLIRMI